MTADPRASAMTSEKAPGDVTPEPEDDDATLDDEFGEDDLDAAESTAEPRGWPLGRMLAITLGIWVGRWFYRLPDGLEALAGLGLVLVTALLAVGLYRRWVRRQLAAARARRRG